MSQREQIRELKKELKKMNDIKAENEALRIRLEKLWTRQQEIIPELQQEIAKLQWKLKSIESRTDPFMKILHDLDILSNTY